MLGESKIRQPALLKRIGYERVISNRRLWAIRIIVGLFLLSNLFAPSSGESSVGYFGGLLIGSTLLLAILYGIFSRKAKDGELDSIRTERELESRSAD